MLAKKPGIISLNSLFFLFVLLMAMYAGQKVGDYYVPDSDFFDFRHKAQAFQDLTWPENTKRLPMYASSIALISAIIPGAEDELLAAQMINLIAFVGSIIALFFLARKIVGKAGFFVAWCYAIHPVTLKMLVKPKADLLTSFLIILAVLLFVHRRKESYLVVFFAALCRYEGALLIPGFFLVDWLWRKRPLRAALGSVTASIGVGGWLLLNALQSGSVNPYSFYYEENHMSTKWLQYLEVTFLNAASFATDHWQVILAILLALATLAGGLLLLRRDQEAAVVLWTYLLGYVALHILWPADLNDYTVMVLWLIFILVIQTLIAWIPRAWFTQWQNTWLTVFLGGVALAVLLWAVDEPGAGVAMNLVSAIFAAGALLLFSGWNGRTSVLPLMFAMFAIISLGYGGQARTELYLVRYAKAEYRVLAEWFEKNAGPNDRLLVNKPVIAHYFTDMEKSRFVATSSIPAKTKEQFIDACIDSNITYVAWVSTDKRRSTDPNIVQDYRYTVQNLYLLDPLLENQHPAFEYVTELNIARRQATVYRVVHNDLKEEE
jgi:hypothetical protein